MVAYVLVIGLLSGVVLSVWCARTIRGAGAASGSRSIRVSLCRCLLYYSIPFSAAVLILLLIQAYLSVSPGSLTYADLVALEGRIDWVHRLFKRVTLPEWVILGILVGVFVGNAVIVVRIRRLPRSRLLRLPARLSRPYHNWVAAVGMFLGVLCAFTFLGTQLGGPRDEVEVRLRTLDRGYAQLVTDTQRALADRAPAAIADQLLANLPPDYIRALRAEGTDGHLLTSIDVRATELAEFYATVVRAYKVNDPAIERLLAAEKARMGRLAAVPRTIDLREPARIAPADRVEPPAWMTSDRLEASRRAVDQVPERGPYLLLREGGTQVLVQLGLTFRDFIARVIAPLVDGVPLSEPMLAALGGLADEVIEQRIRAAAAGLAESLLSDPTGPTAKVDERSAAIGRELAAGDEAGLRRYAQRANELLAASKRDLAALDAALNRLHATQRRAEGTVTDALIARLSRGSEQNAKNVAAALANRGQWITPAQIRRLTQIMHTGTRRWAGPEYIPWSGAHCTCRAHHSVRRYAAVALQGIDSPLVSPDLRAEAGNVIANSTTYSKRSEPGWVCTVNGSSSAEALCGTQ